LEAAGSSLDKIVSATFILRDPEDFAGMNDEWQVWFPIDPPARAGRPAAGGCGRTAGVNRRRRRGLKAPARVRAGVNPR
jgi:enamine deaminase RidA (YjgF/YER057c/UK114 family)